MNPPAELPFELDAPLGEKMLAAGMLAAGRHVKMQGLSDDKLNGKWLAVVRVFTDERKIAIDATDEHSAPTTVRHVKVPAAKVELVVCYPTNKGAHDVRFVVNATNCGAAIRAAGLDPALLEFLPVRPHPAIAPGRLWMDLPELLQRLNRERAPGHPFRAEFGYQIFAQPPLHATDVRGCTEFESVFSSEPCMVLRNCCGCGIDVSPDVAKGTSQECTHKLFIPDPALSPTSFRCVADVIKECHGLGWLPRVSWEEDLARQFSHAAGTEAASNDAISLGMIRGDLNQRTENVGYYGTLIIPFQDHALSRTAESSECYAVWVAQMRKRVLGGMVHISRNLAIQLDETHADGGSHGVQLLNREGLGTVCFACYTRLTIEEVVRCGGGCGKAVYCSRGCQEWHWKEHKKCCRSFKECERQRAATTLAAREREEKKTLIAKERAGRAKEHEERIRRHDEREDLTKAEAAASAAQRKARAARSRADSAAKHTSDIAERIRHAAPQPQRRGDKRRKAAARTTEQELVHAAWASETERSVRSAAFTANQEAVHLEALARKAAERVAALRELARAASAAAEAATHVVPPPPTVAAVMAQV